MGRRIYATRHGTTEGATHDSARVAGGGCGNGFWFGCRFEFEFEFEFEGSFVDFSSKKKGDFRRNYPRIMGALTAE